MHVRGRRLGISNQYIKTSRCLTTLAQPNFWSTVPLSYYFGFYAFARSGGNRAGSLPLLITQDQYPALPESEIWLGGSYFSPIKLMLAMSSINAGGC